MPTAPSSNYRHILGIRFYVGPLGGLIEQTRQGGLIVVPSAPVLVGLTGDPAHRQALEASDLAVTDSGFMVILWGIFQRERLVRISGLRYLRTLLDWREFREPGATFWIMPSKRDEVGNRFWLAEQGMAVAEDECYIAPIYSSQGPLEDPALLALIEARRPRFVMINLGGGVQERLGWYLKDALEKAETGNLKPESSDSCPAPQTSSFSSHASSSSSDLRFQVSGFDRPASPAYHPALICTGAAIAFLSNRQVNIPPWADRLVLGWLMRSLSEPAKFIPRYWRSLRLVALLWKHGSKSVSLET